MVDAGPVTVDPATGGPSAGVDGGLDAARSRLEAIPARLAELIAFGAIVGLAAVLRFVDLRTRGTWDADQGHDMLVLRDLVEHGTIPLLGPPTSIGDFHHGMLYYLLLAPAAAVSHVDPTAVTAWIAIGGVAAVAITGWLARSVAGPIAGLVAAGLMAVSASAIEESTFIWNPNLIALSSSVALAAAWRAWITGRTGWWVVAGAAAVLTMQCHVLGVILTPVIAALLVADIWRRRQAHDARATARAVTAAGWWLLLGVLSYVPLVIHEAQTQGSEVRAALAYLAGGDGPGGPGVAARLPIVGLRVVGWPLVGLITSGIAATAGASVLVVTATIWRAWPSRQRSFDPDRFDARADGARRRERIAVRWLGLGLVWSIVALAVAAPSLAAVVPGLPNDHYHAFADPIVFVLAAVGIAALVRLGGAVSHAAAVGRAGAVGSPGAAESSASDAIETSRRGAPPIGALIAPATAAVLLVGLVSWNLLHLPAAIAVDGGWPAAQRAAEQIVAQTGGAPVRLLSLPTVKSADAVRFPLVQIDPTLVVDDQEGAAAGASAAGGGTAGAGVTVTGPAATVVLCDQLFHETIGADCGGAAENALVATLPEGSRPGPLVGRFEAAPGRWISIYAAPAG